VLNLKYSVSKLELSSNAIEVDFLRLRGKIKNNFDNSQHAKFFSTNQAAINPQYFSLDGSLVCTEEFFEKNAPAFFQRSRRVTKFRNLVHLRGTRYTISSNPTFELRQKLLSFQEDYEEALDALPQQEFTQFQLAMADYIKNSVLTILNSFVYDEKIGNYKFTRPIYQKRRAAGIKLALSACELFYGAFTNNQDMYEAGYFGVKKNINVFKKMSDDILDAYRAGIFSSRHLTRPEAAHPQIMALAAYNYAKFSDEKPDLIVGLPSGSTELALTHYLAQKVLSQNIANLLLIPVSLHSIKHDFDFYEEAENALPRFIKHHQQKFEGKKVLIIDDNSSTGRTIQKVCDAIKITKAISISVAVAEADLVRSKLDINASNRPMISSEHCYRYAVGILPVSRRFSPKRDIKDILERKKMVSCVKARYGSDVLNLTNILIRDIYSDLIMNRTQERLPLIPKEGLISEFRHTFLSNFYSASVYYQGESYLSVEHAYQAMKFENSSFKNVSEEDIIKINKRLESRGTFIKKEMLPYMFTSTSMTAGTSKTVANQLRRLGYVRKDWDDAKLPIMIELVIQKFSNISLFQRLEKTGDKYLIEGNDWGDTYWGVVNGRGRNVLGRLLMSIRELNYDSLLEYSNLLTAKHITWKKHH